MGAAKMRPGKKGRSVKRVVVAAAIAVATLVTVVLVGNQTALADVFWSFGGR